MMMRKIGLVLASVAFTASVVPAQTHKVAKPETVVRAVAVYEWTGDLAKPKASRLIPVTIFIDGELQDAGVYLARPVPLALDSGNLYELQEAGVSKGNLELAYARHLRAVETATGDSLFDDGWFGYGNFKPLVTKKPSVLRASKEPVQIKAAKDDSKPHFSGRGGKDDSGKDAAKTDSAPTGSATPEDADRPTMKRRSGSSDTSDSSTPNTTASKTPASPGADAGTPDDDPDRPRLSKKPSSDSSGSDTVPGDVDGQNKPASSGGSSSGSSAPPTTAQGGSADDPDRPTLKRRTPEEIKRDQKKEDRASVSGVGSLNDDPDRPNLHRGKPASAMTEDDLPRLQGLPPDLKQMVAVSDAANRPVHEFGRPWEDDKERSAILTKMQVLARAKLADYGVTPTPSTPPPSTSKPATTVTARRTAAKKKAAATPPAIALLDEELKGYTLSYGGAATYIYAAHTTGTGATLDYVTVVAQADALGELKPAIQNVTDAAHLDRTPRMRLVDVVDAEASNRASLLFELRGQQSRQFGLYSIIGARADQKFLSGTTQ